MLVHVAQTADELGYEAVYLPDHFHTIPPSQGALFESWTTAASYHLFHAARADLLRRDGQLAAASCAYKQALTLCQNEREHAFLAHRLAEIETA